MRDTIFWKLIDPITRQVPAPSTLTLLSNSRGMACIASLTGGRQSVCKKDKENESHGNHFLLFQPGSYQKHNLPCFPF